jgi:hypothetical protein
MTKVDDLSLIFTDFYVIAFSGFQQDIHNMYTYTHARTRMLQRREEVKEWQSGITRLAFHTGPKARISTHVTVARMIEPDTEEITKTEVTASRSVQCPKQAP